MLLLSRCYLSKISISSSFIKQLSNTTNNNINKFVLLEKKTNGIFHLTLNSQENKNALSKRLIKEV